MRTPFDAWLRERPYLVHEVIGDMDPRSIIANCDDELAQGTMINKALYERYLEWLAEGPSRPEPDTERMREARAINAENRRAIGSGVGA